MNLAVDLLMIMHVISTNHVIMSRHVTSLDSKSKPILDEPCRGIDHSILCELNVCSACSADNTWNNCKSITLQERSLNSRDVVIL